jgi:hypothetical protein
LTGITALMAQNGCLLLIQPAVRQLAGVEAVIAAELI